MDIWNKLKYKTNVETEIVLNGIRDAVSNKYIRAALLWYAAKTLRNKGVNSLVGYYMAGCFSIVLARPSILEFLTKLFLDENNKARYILLAVIQFYSDTCVDYLVLLLVTIVLLITLYFNYLGIKARNIEEVIHRQVLSDIAPIVPFSVFFDFYSNHEVKQFVTDPVYEKCRQILRDSSKGHVRLLALSGTGKTFLIKSAFSEQYDNSKVFYCDDVKHTGMVIAALNLKKNFQDATLILDNCPSDICENIIRKIGDKVRVISAYYDPRDNAQGANLLTFEDCDMNDIISRIIDDNILKPISKEQRQNIIKHSGNIPFMALLLVKAFNQSQGIYENVDKELLKHLLDIQGQHPVEQRIAMHTLALLQPFDFNDTKSEVSQYLINSDTFTPIESILKRDVLFKNVVKNLYSRNLIDMDSVFINVRPQPLAIWLVGEWMKERGKSVTEAILELSQQPKTLRESILTAWARRLEYMQGNEDAEEIYAHLVDINGGPFANEDVVCSDFGSRLILAMSTVNPVAISECLHFVLFNQSVDWLRNNLIGDARRNIVNTLEKLCFNKSTFHQSALILAKLAVAENEDWANNSKGQFRQLFHVYLAGTEANLQERVVVLKELYDSGKEFRPLVLSALNNSFAIQGLSRMGGAEKFGFVTLEDFRPTGSDIKNYWDEIYELLTEWIKKLPEELPAVAEIVQRNARNIVRANYSSLLFKYIEVIAALMDYHWNEMHKTLIDIKNYDYLPEDKSQTLQEWIQRLTPKDIVNRMKMAVHDIYTQNYKSEDIIDKEEEIAKPFAIDFVHEKGYLTKEMDGLISNESDYISWAFTRHLALQLPAEEIEPMGDYVKSVVLSYDKTFYSRFLISLYGYLKGRAGTQKLCGELFDEGYISMAIPLMAVTDDNNLNNLIFVLQGVKNGLTSFDDTRKYLSAIRLNNSTEILKVTKILINNGADNALLFDFIAKYWYLEDVYNNQELLDLYKGVLIEYKSKENGRYNYEYARQVENVLSKSVDTEFALKINQKLIDLLSNNKACDDIEDIYKVLLNKYWDVIWPDFIKALTDLDNKPSFYIQVRYKIGSGFEFGEGPLFAGHEEDMKKTCKMYPKYGPLICASLCPVFDDIDINTGEIESFHPFVLWLLKNHGDDKRVLDELHSNLYTFHWTGSLLPLLEDRKRCFQKLLNDGSLPSIVRDWAKQCIEANQEDINRETQNDAYMRMAYNH